MAAGIPTGDAAGQTEQRSGAAAGEGHVEHALVDGAAGLATAVGFNPPGAGEDTGAVIATGARIDPQIVDLRAARRDGVDHQGPAQLEIAESAGDRNEAGRLRGGEVFDQDRNFEHPL